jgi:hypothetical protein
VVEKPSGPPVLPTGMGPRLRSGQAFGSVRLAPYCGQDDSAVSPAGISFWRDGRILSPWAWLPSSKEYTSGRLCAMRRNATLADEYEDSMEFVPDSCLCVPA